ncbi:MAG: type II secretion system F family protein [Planctomycetes bacterium]|nr:type II secretion system F family protein [Planctomycetota bacterium]
MWLSDARLFLSELAVFLESGVPIRDALQELAAGPRRAVARLSKELLSRLAAGTSLAEGLRQASGALSPDLVAVIEAGERSGKLPLLLRRMASEVERRLEAQKTLILRAAYPLAILFLLAWLAPLFLLVEGRAGAYLLLETSLFIPAGLVAGGGWWLFHKAKQNAALRWKLADWLRQMPVFGSALYRLSLGRSLSLLGLLLESGLSFRDALPLVARASAFHPLAEDFRRLEASLAEGRSFAEGLGLVRGLPGPQRLGIANGERTGTLDRALEEAGERLSEAAWRKVMAVVWALPVAVYLIAGAAILLVMLNLISKLYPGL